MAEGAACEHGTLQAGQVGGEAGEGPKPEPQLKQMGLGEKVRRQEGNKGVTRPCFVIVCGNHAKLCSCTANFSTHHGKCTPLTWCYMLP